MILSLLYLGPGMSGGFLALIIAILLSFITFIGTIIFYPVKKLIQFIKKIVGK